MTITEKYKELKAEFELYKLESIKWGIDDIISRAEDIGYEIGENDARAALHKMIRNHDCNYGISWESLDDYIMEYGTELGFEDGEEA